MVPMQDLRRIYPAAVRARPISLQFAQPLGSAVLETAAAFGHPGAGAQIPLAIKNLPTRLAVRLQPVAASRVAVKLRSWLGKSGARAAPHLSVAHPFDINMNIGADLRRGARGGAVAACLPTP